jgi:hypothetical protein
LAVVFWIASLSGLLGAQAASYTYLDQRAPYSNPTPEWLTALNTPRIGTTLTVEVPLSFQTCCPFEKVYFLATGATNPSLRYDPLGGWLFTSADVSVVQVPHGSPYSRTTITFAIPNSPSLLGAPLFQQVLEHAHNSFWSTLYLSRGGRGVIGT